MNVNLLIDVLEREYNEFFNLIVILKSKRNAIEQNDILSLKKVIEEEKHKIDVLDELERERVQIVFDISDDLKVNSTLSSITNALDDPWRHDLAVTVAKMTNLINEVSLINLGIQRMITYRLEEFDMIMDLFKNQDKTYDGSSHFQSGMIFNGKA